MSLRIVDKCLLAFQNLLQTSAKILAERGPISRTGFWTPIGGSDAWGPAVGRKGSFFAHFWASFLFHFWVSFFLCFWVSFFARPIQALLGISTASLLAYAPVPIFQTKNFKNAKNLPKHGPIYGPAFRAYFLLPLLMKVQFLGPFSGPVFWA